MFVFRALIKSAIAFYLFFYMLSAHAVCVDQVPRLTGSNPSVATSGDYSASYPGWKAFDKSRGTMWISEVWETPAWISYRFPSATVVNRYTIDYVNGGILTRAPKDFMLQARRSPLLPWTTLDQRTNQTNWRGSEKRTYDFSNSNAYSEYRLLVSDDNDIRSNIVVISMGEFTLEHCSGIDPSNILGQWHEDTSQGSANIEHYVPIDVDLGGARFRNALNFYPGGVAEILVLAPNDAHYFVSGTWTLSGDILTINFYRKQSGSVVVEYEYIYRVLDADGDNLRLEIISK